MIAIPETLTGRSREAAEILLANDRGEFSVPTRGLYPFQWNWDSAFAALGYSHLDGERAVRELESLAGAQWPDGMIPHIVFHRPDPGYFPGPEAWGTDRTPPTSGISQPPVFATAVRRLADRGLVSGERLRRLVETAERWHAWFGEARMDEATGAIGVVHPWESGRDNLPDWDVPLSAVDASGVKPYQRRDLGHVDASMRPTKDQYDRFMALVEFGQSVGWDQKRLKAESPFFVGDPGVTAILIRAERDLADLAEGLGDAEMVKRIRGRAERLAAGMDALWNEEIGAYATLDIRGGGRGPAVSAASFLGFYAGVARGAKAASLNAHFDRIAGRCRYLMPSWDPDSPLFDEKRYWRGPAWLVVNRLIAAGFAWEGDEARAKRIRDDSRALVAEGGFYEYYSPLTGAPLGGADFTWTAAMWLDWAREEV